jgi:molybdopterin/thiamine biosynthesis adenylyltransferase
VVSPPVDRYVRHTTLPEIGAAGQERLARSAVLVVGCGALGSVLAQVMVRSGVGRVRIADADAVELHNLHRQLLYDEEDVASGRPKVELAAAKLRRMNSAVVVEPVAEHAHAGNVEALVAGVDLVLDATDNFPVRYLVNEACVRVRRPWVYGGILGTVGMTLSVFPGEGPCFECFMPEPPEEDGLLSPERHGVLATAPIVVAALQATEALKILLGSPQVSRRLVTVDVWSQELVTYEVRRSPTCPVCVGARFARLDGGGP